MNLGKFVKNYPEKYGARILSRIFWSVPSVAVLAHGENNDILVLNLDGEYRLPGGLIKAGEDPKEAAAREVSEETGFEVEIHNILDIRTHESGGFTVFFEAEVIQGEKNGSWEGDPDFVKKPEVEDMVWSLEHSHIREYLFPDEN